MSLQYVETRDQLPIDSDYLCPICLDTIDIDGTVDGIPNCVICTGDGSGNGGHRMHYVCFTDYVKSGKQKCPLCESTDFRRCNSIYGYAYVPRKGGKKRKTYKKMKPHKTHKKRKNKNTRRVKGKKV